MIHDVLTIEEAKKHLREYNIISDSLQRHNKMVSDLILSEIVKDKDEDSSNKTKKLYIYSCDAYIADNTTWSFFYNQK